MSDNTKATKEAVHIDLREPKKITRAEFEALNPRGGAFYQEAVPGKKDTYQVALILAFPDGEVASTSFVITPEAITKTLPGDIDQEFILRGLVYSGIY